MERREFIVRIGESLITVPMAIYVVGCGYGDDGGEPSGPAVTEDGFNVASSAASGHTHNVTVLFADLSSPPTDGVTYTSTSTGGHTHRITLDQQELVQLESGEQVTAMSTVSNGHSHNWVIQKP